MLYVRLAGGHLYWNSCSRDVFIDVSFCCPFFPRAVLDEIWDLIGSVSEGFPAYFLNRKQI